MGAGGSELEQENQNLEGRVFVHCTLPRSVLLLMQLDLMSAQGFGMGCGGVGSVEGTGAKETSNRCRVSV